VLSLACIHVVSHVLCRCPALFLAKDAVLSTFSVAKQTAIVVDSGYSSTTGNHGDSSCMQVCIRHSCVSMLDKHHGYLYTSLVPDSAGCLHGGLYAASLY
jgi:hypothetical protein